MQTIYSFPPIAGTNASTLILGSMPGKISLQKQQYYAHPQNAFWKIVGEIMGFAATLTYAQRSAALANAGIAIWDVLQSCLREGSLDADIDHRSIVANDFVKFYAEHPNIRRVFFNGAKAEAIYLRQVLPLLTNSEIQQRDIIYTRLPSTSPAHAAMTRAHKLEAWRAIAPL